MSDPQNTSTSGPDSSPDQTASALFAQLVLQLSNMAAMLLGKVAHPESGKVVRDLESARLFIDQLEMLEVKTRGNLSKEENNLLKQTLMTLRLAFVEAAEEPAAKPAEAQPQAAKAEEPAKAESAAAAAAEDEHRKKFSKKY
jgi:Domain of unknown function (DUF1844)